MIFPVKSAPAAKIFNTYIPPSDEDTDDQENFQLFLQKNTATLVSNPDYQPASTTTVYSQLVPIQTPCTWCKYNSHIHLILSQVY